MQWNKPETAPKDSMFIADVGFPWGVSCIWSGCDEKFVYADLQINMVDGKYNDPYFETDSIKVVELKGWMPLPETIK